MQRSRSATTTTNVNFKELLGNRSILKLVGFTPSLKHSRDYGVLRGSGRAFCKPGAAEQNARSPIVQNLVGPGGFGEVGGPGMGGVCVCVLVE